MLGNDTTNMYCAHFGYPVEERSNGMSPKVPGGVRTSNMFKSFDDLFNVWVFTHSLFRRRNTSPRMLIDFAIFNSF